MQIGVEIKHVKMKGVNGWNGNGEWMVAEVSGEVEI